MIRSMAAAAFLVSTALGGPALAKAPKPAPAPDPAATAAALRDKALQDPTAYEVVSSLTTEVGGRMAGSPAAARARDWGLAKLRALGFQNVHAEPFTITAWARGPESAEIVAPYPHRLMILGLGRSVSTPPEGIEAEVALFHSYAEMLAATPGSLTGKIAVVDQPVTRTQDGSGYGAAVTARTQGASQAARRGAVAYLVRSISTSDSRLPHAGAMRYADDAPQIPAAAISVPDAELLDRMTAMGQPVRLKLTMTETTTPDAPAWNVSGEIPGSEKPDEVVVIGGHLDSWDPGEGAIDDGAGVAITTGAAKVIMDLPRHPRRTIRVVMFGDEEMDFSGKAYADAHKDETARIVATGESDVGADAIWSLQLPSGAAAAPALKPLAGVLAPLKIFIANEPARFSGSDFAELSMAGVPAFAYRQDASRYFDWHHSADDTLNKVDPVSLRQNVAAWAALVYLIADSDVDFRALAAAPAPEHP